MGEILSGDRHVHPVKADGTTIDIIETIMDADKCNAAYVPDGYFLKGNTVLETCHNIWEFVTTNIEYVEDPEGRQDVQSPGALWNNRRVSKGGTGLGGDCKSMSIMCSAILKALLIEFMYRFVSEVPNEDLYHVYIIVRDDTGDGYITLDCTLKHFNRELKLAEYVDVDPAPAGAICPFPSPAQIGYTVNDTAEENSGDEWANHESAFFNTRVNDGGYINNLKNAIISDIRDHWAGHPSKQQAAAGFINDLWPNHLKMAALMIYHYWGDTSLFMGDFVGKPIPDIENVDIWIGAAEITVKAQNGRDYYDDLKGLGVSDAHLKDLIKLSIYNNHGITLDYLLYRCYNKLTYGQEWGLLPGVPYYNANTQEFFPNGATDEEVFALINAFPLDGGTGKPWGMPYISRGIFIMTNGATDEAIAALSTSINAHGWTWYINHFVKPGSTENWDLKTISDADIVKATEMYYRWQQGQLPVLYANPVLGSLLTVPGGTNIDPFIVVLNGPRVGEITTAVAALITGIIAAVIGFATYMIQQFLINPKTSKQKLEQNPPIGPKDFKLQYQTADGCAIGYTTTCPSGVGKACSSGFTCITNLTLPENQPIDNNFNPLNPEESSNKWLGLGLAAAGLVLLTTGDNKKP